MNTSETDSVPRGDAQGFVRYWKSDLLSGFLVFLIALPLCLGISIASGFPPIAGIFTAIAGALITTCISNSELTIKGPAAGMIVIVLGCVEEFGGNGLLDSSWDATDIVAYRATLAVGVAAAVLQILFGFFRAGILGEFFPTSAVHGMLAAIGAIIMIKQFPVALGVKGAGGPPFAMLQKFPEYITTANPAIASIGIVSLLIMFLWPLVRKRVAMLKAIPAPLVVLLVAVPMGMGFDLLHEHSYSMQGHQYELNDAYLVQMPDRMFGLFDDVTTPDFSVLSRGVAWKWVIMFFIIGTLESLLSARAIDLLDPWKRKSSMDRDCVAVGVANLGAAWVGGLPMISEIVRSKANIDNGAKTRFADFWHGIFLLLCVALIPTWLHRIPLAALAAMLVYTGSRLAHPSEFMHVYRIGKHQLIIFVTTMITVLATDLLIGVATGIALKMALHMSNGVPLRTLFKPDVEVKELSASTILIVARESAVFSNWIPLRRQIMDTCLEQNKNLILDLSNTRLVDHSVMVKLEAMQREFEQEGLVLELRGLDSLQPLSSDIHAARKQGLASVKRLTIVAEARLRERLENLVTDCGASGYTSQDCSGAGRHEIHDRNGSRKACVRMEVVAPFTIAEKILQELGQEEFHDESITTCVETVDVVKHSDFVQISDEQIQLTDNH